jgi:hypothetical protein
MRCEAACPKPGARRTDFTSAPTSEPLVQKFKTSATLAATDHIHLRNSERPGLYLSGPRLAAGAAS